MRRNIFVFCNVIVAALLSLTSCNEPNTLLGVDLLPDSDKLKILYIEDGDIHASHFRMDTLNTYANDTIGLVGILNDPVFGSSEASLLVQFMPSYLGTFFDETSSVDSLVLIFARKNLYGDKSQNIQLNLYQITDPGFNDTTLFPVNLDPVGMFDPNPISQTTLTPADTVIRFNLSLDLANELVNWGKDTAVNNNRWEFLNKFHGFYLKAEPASGIGFMQAISMYNKNFSYTGMFLYFHDSEGDSLRMDYLPLDNFRRGPSARFNVIHHDYTTAGFTSDIYDSLYSGSSLYLQGMAGIGVKLRFPFLESWKNRTDSVIAFHRVILSIPAVTNSYDERFFRPQFLSILRKDSLFSLSSESYLQNASAFDLIQDHYLSNADGIMDPYNGIYNATSNSYNFLITNHCQSYVLGQINSSDLYLFGTPEDVKDKETPGRKPDVRDYPWFTAQTFERVILSNDPLGSHISIKVEYSVYPK